MYPASIAMIPSNDNLTFVNLITNNKIATNPTFINVAKIPLYPNLTIKIKAINNAIAISI